MSRRELEKSITRWCDEHRAALVHEKTSPLGERYEIRWYDDDRIVVRFIDIYPREDRVLLQKGIFPATAADAPEQSREKGPLYSRPIDQVYDTLSQLKPSADRMSPALVQKTWRVEPAASFAKCFERLAGEPHANRAAIDELIQGALRRIVEDPTAPGVVEVDGHRVRVLRTAGLAIAYVISAPGTVRPLLAALAPPTSEPDTYALARAATRAL